MDPLPFDDESIPNLFKKIKSGMYSLPTHLSQLAKNLIPRMLEVDPMKRITIPEIRLHPWFQHKLPPYLRHPPELMEKQERVVDSEVIDEVMKLPFHKAYGSLNQNGTSNHMMNGVMQQQQQQYPIVSRDLVERAAALEDSREQDTPKLLRDLRCAYELILDHKHTRLRVMEVARAIKEAASATPPAFSPGGSRGATPGGSHYGSSAGRYGASSGGSYDGRFASNLSYSSHHSQSPTTLNSPANQARLAEEATRALMQPGSQQSAGPSSSHPPSSTHTPISGGVGDSSHPVVQMTSSIPGNTGMIAQHQHGRRTRRWYLGIQSKKDPAHVMTEVYKALKALDCEWLQLSSYRIKCKWRPNVPRGDDDGLVSPIYGVMPTAGGETPGAAFQNTGSMDTDGDVSMGEEGKDRQRRAGGGGGGAVHALMQVVAGDDGHQVPVPNLSTQGYSIKIGLTLYKVQQNIYLLDFQKKTGDAFSFMTLCANIITELKTLSAASRQQQLLQQQQAAAAAAQQQAMQQQQQQAQGGYPPS